MVLNEIGMKGTVASSGDDLYNALTLLRYGRIKTDQFRREVRSLDDAQQAIEEFVASPRILKIQLAIDD